MGETRKVGERGQVTIPKRLREKENIRSGDELEFVEENGEIFVRKKDDLEQELIEGYEAMGEKDSKTAEECKHVSKEANRYLED
jgi:AbrB family looped-hinge helix DNA binding protein